MSFSFLIVALIGHAVPQSAFNKTQMVVVVALQRCVLFVYGQSREIEYPWCPGPCHTIRRATPSIMAWP